MADLNNSFRAFVISCIIFCLVAQCAVSFGHFLSAVSPTVSIANILAGPILGPLMLFAGHFLNNL